MLCDYSPISFREATIKHLELLEYWDKQFHVIASDSNDDWNWDIELRRQPDWREQLIILKDNIPIGFIQIIDPHLEETHY